MRIAAASKNSLFLPLAVATVGLGCVGAAFHDFALQWQPVPNDISHRRALALVAALTLAGLGASMLSARLRARAAIVLAGLFTGWALALHAPRVAAAPANVAMWLGLCEIGALAAGALAIAGFARGNRRWLVAARLLLGTCAIVFGVSHFVYADFTAAMVPSWLPGAMGWALLTGAGHTLAGLSLLSGIRSRLASIALAAMCGAFVLLLHIPRLVVAPDSHMEWTMTFMALAIAGAALSTAAAPERGEAERPGASVPTGAA